MVPRPRFPSCPLDTRPGQDGQTSLCVWFLSSQLFRLWLLSNTPLRTSSDDRVFHRFQHHLYHWAVAFLRSTSWALWIAIPQSLNPAPLDTPIQSHSSVVSSNTLQLHTFFSQGTPSVMHSDGRGRLDLNPFWGATLEIRMGPNKTPRMT